MPLKKVEGNIQFHFRRQSFPLVQKIIRILEREGVALFEYFSYRPSSVIHILLEENPTLSNGSASIFPDNVVTLITFPPLDSDFLLGEDDPVKNLVVHELAHIVHLDQTGGINRALQKVFGSTGKLMPATVPRWFSEGVATWAETRFTQGGRQRLSGVIWQVERALLDPSACSDLSCLDSPGAYPYGSGSYWIGADFLTWIEARKEGSIRCLVRENADNLIFFLNHAFSSCLGESGSALFARYRRERREEILGRQRALRGSPFVQNSLRPVAVNRNGPMDWERGASIFEGKLHYLWHRPRREVQMGVWDLERGTLQSRRPSSFISSFLPPSGGLLPIRVQDDHSYWHRRRVVALKSGRTLLPRELGAEYAFSMGEGGKWLYFAWDGSRWVIGEHHPQKGEGRILHRLPRYVSIKRPRLFHKEGHPWVSFQVFGDSDERWPYQLWVWRLGEERPFVLVKKREAFTYWEQCEGTHLVKGASGAVELFELNALDQVVRKEVRVDWADQIAWVVWDGEHTVLFLQDDPEQAWSMPKGCGAIVAELSREVHAQSVEMASRPNQPLTADIPNTLNNYSPWSHLAPSWWMLGGRYLNERFHASLETSLEDPKRLHTVALKLQLPTQGKKFDFFTSYAHRFSDFRESYARIGYNRSGGEHSSQSTTLSLYENVYFSGLIWVPMLSLSEERDEDDYGERFFQKVSLSQQWTYHSSQRSDFFRQAGWDLRLSRSWHRSHFAYTGLGAGLHLFLRPLSRLSAGFRVRYDRLLKKSHSRGELLYGGGVGTPHSFYGLDYQDAFGDDLMTARGYLDGELARIYSSWKLVPFYVKDIRLLAGMDYIKTDFVWLAGDNIFVQNELLRSTWWGLRLKFDIFYRSSGTWDFLQASLHSPLGGQEHRFISSFNLSF